MIQELNMPLKESGVYVDLMFRYDGNILKHYRHKISLGVTGMGRKHF